MALGETRRKDREIGDAESEALLDGALVGRIGTVGRDGIPYVVPMNFVYSRSSRTLFFHCATAGHLLDNLEGNPAACFEVDEAGEVVATGPAACDTAHIYRSVICFGQARIVDDLQAKEQALRLFVEKYVDRLMPERRYEPELETIDTTAVVALRVDTMTGKARRPS